MKNTYYFLVSLLSILTFGGSGNAYGAAETAGACVHRPAASGVVEKRVAIIVGDGAYANGIPALANPTHDAEATAKALTTLGFEIYLSTNAPSAALQQCLDEAYAHLGDAGVAMLYYSGHGIQIKDENYLVATDAGTGDLKHGFVPVQPIVDALQSHAKATLVLLDACRNNPLASAEGGHVGLSVSTGRGLTRVGEAAGVASAPAAIQARGLMVAYSTSPNAVAQDGTGDLSPFTGAFVKSVGTSGYSIQRVMSDVTRSVGEQTDWTQTPWMKSSLTSELKLGGGETLAEAQSASDNHAAKSSALLDTNGDKQGAIVEALKGLPASPDDATLKRFPKAYLALYTAVQGREFVLPIEPGMTHVAVSPQNRAAVFQRSPDFRSGSFDLWSISEQKVVAKPDVGRGGSERFVFGPHGKLLAASIGGTTRIFNGVDGTRITDVRGSASDLEFSPDETRLMLAGTDRLTVDEIGTGKSSVFNAGQLAGETRQRGYISKATFGGNDRICFVLSSGTGGNSVLGVFDLMEGKTVRRREVGQSVNTMMCDPAGKYMVRTLAATGGDQGLEIWDLAADKVTTIKAPIVNIMGIDPKGHYVSVLAFESAAQGFYDLATGKKGYPPTVPDTFWILGSRVRNPTGGLVSQDVTNNPWRDWPDETLFGPGLFKAALAGLTPAQRADVDRGRIAYTVVAGNP